MCRFICLLYRSRQQHIGCYVARCVNVVHHKYADQRVAEKDAGVGADSAENVLYTSKTNSEVGSSL